MKEIVIVSQRDKIIFDEFFLIVAGVLGGLGAEPLINSLLTSWGFSYPTLNWIELGISFLVILFVVAHLRKISDTKK